jgi:hypothetical protein
MTEEMHRAVTIVLARMDSHPEEFTGSSNRYGKEGPNTRWVDTLRELLEHTTPEETEAIKTKLRGIRMEHIHYDIIQELLK